MATEYQINPLTGKLERFEKGTFFIGYTFESTVARDTYFSTNPSELEEWLVVEITTDPATFYQYINSTWIEITPLVKGDKGDTGNQGTPGQDGRDGSAWFTDSVDPTGTDGEIKDFWLNSTSGDYFEKTGSSTWTLRGNLLGPQGIQGTQGPQGIQGPQGEQGIQGEPGTVEPSAYGEMYFHENSTPITLTNQNTWYLIDTTWTEGEYDHFQVNTPTNKITCEQTDVYHCNIQLNYSASPNQEYEFAVFVDGVQSTKLTTHSTSRSSGTTISAPILGLLSLNSGNILDLRCRCTSSSGKTITPVHVNFVLVANREITPELGSAENITVVTTNLDNNLSGVTGNAQAMLEAIDEFDLTGGTKYKSLHYYITDTSIIPDIRSGTNTDNLDVYFSACMADLVDGDVLVIPPGTYHGTDLLRFLEKANIKVLAYGVTLKAHPDLAPQTWVTFHPPWSYWGLNCISCTDIDIYGVTFDGNMLGLDPGAYYGSGAVYAGTRVRLHDCKRVGDRVGFRFYGPCVDCGWDGYTLEDNDYAGEIGHIDFLTATASQDDFEVSVVEAPYGEDVHYEVEIDSVGATDTFKFRWVFHQNGVEPTFPAYEVAQQNIPIPDGGAWFDSTTAGTQPSGFPITKPQFRFLSKTGHQVGDKWTFLHVNVRWSALAFNNKADHSGDYTDIPNPQASGLATGNSVKRLSIKENHSDGIGIRAQKHFSLSEFDVDGGIDALFSYYVPVDEDDCNDHILIEKGRVRNVLEFGFDFHAINRTLRDIEFENCDARALNMVVDSYTQGITLEGLRIKNCCQLTNTMHYESQAYPLYADTGSIGFVGDGTVKSLVMRDIRITDDQGSPTTLGIDVSDVLGTVAFDSVIMDSITDDGNLAGDLFSSEIEPFASPGVPLDDGIHTNSLYASGDVNITGDLYVSKVYATTTSSVADAGALRFENTSTVENGTVYGVIGICEEALANHAATNGKIVGGYAIARKTTDKNINTMTGLSGYVTSSGGSGTVSNAYALLASSNYTGLTVTNSYGVFAPAATNGTVVTAYGAYLWQGSGGTVENCYGLYLGNINRGSVLNYSIYSAGGTGYHAGIWTVGDEVQAAGFAHDTTLPARFPHGAIGPGGNNPLSMPGGADTTTLRLEAGSSYYLSLLHGSLRSKSVSLTSTNANSLSLNLDTVYSTVDGSLITTQHYHNKLIASDSSPDAITADASGNLRADYLIGLGTDAGHQIHAIKTFTGTETTSGSSNQPTGTFLNYTLTIDSGLSGTNVFATGMRCNLTKDNATNNGGALFAFSPSASNTGAGNLTSANGGLVCVNAELTQNNSSSTVTLARVYRSRLIATSGTITTGANFAVRNASGGSNIGTQVGFDCELLSGATVANLAIRTAAGNTQHLGGTTRLGDLTTNYAEFSSTGNLSFTGSSRIAWTKITAASVTVTAGTTTDTVSKLQTMQDGNIFNLTEAAATPGMDMYVEFTSVTGFNFVTILGGYDGSASHGVAIQMYDWTNTVWKTFDCFQDTYCDTTTSQGNILCRKEFMIRNNADYIGTGGNAGKVRVRFYHTPAGNVAHNLYLDEVALYQ